MVLSIDSTLEFVDARENRKWCIRSKFFSPLFSLIWVLPLRFFFLIIWAHLVFDLPSECWCEEMLPSIISQNHMSKVVFLFIFLLKNSAFPKCHYVPTWSEDMRKRVICFHWFWYWRTPSVGIKEKFWCFKKILFSLTQQFILQMDMINDLVWIFLVSCI